MSSAPHPSSGRDLSVLVARLVVGGYLSAHGAQKLFGTFGGPGLQTAAAGFERLGLRPGRVAAQVASVSELCGGSLLALGAAHPVGPVAIAGTMAVASSAHRANGAFSANRGFELPLTNLAAALVLWSSGPGRFSLDGLTGFRLPKWMARLVVLGAVGSAAVALRMVLSTKPLATAPEPDPEDTGGEPEGVDEETD